jgi:hypothetical protein
MRNLIWLNIGPTLVVDISKSEKGGKDEVSCPTCGESIPSSATECPKCGEAIAVETVEEPEPEKAPKKRNWLFWIGILLVLAGGPGIAVGSWLHDILHIPIGGDAFDVFGWLNRLVAAVGTIILLVGLLVLAIAIARSGRDEDDEES